MYKKTLIAKLSADLPEDLQAEFAEKVEVCEEVEGKSLLDAMMEIKESILEAVNQKDDTSKKDPAKGADKGESKEEAKDADGKKSKKEEVWDQEKDQKYVDEAKKVKESDDEEWDDEKDQDFPDDEEEKEEEEMKESKKKSVKESVLDKVASEEISIEEDVNALFEGEELSEDFKSKATTIFEAAVASKVSAYKESVNEAIESVVAEEVEAISEELSTKIDQYLDYVVEEWMKENEIAIEHGLRTEVTEGFISGLKNLFIENYVEIPEGKENMLDSVIEEKAKLAEEFETEVEKNIELTKELKDLKKGVIISEVCKGLADTEAEKLQGLAEEVKFEDVESFAKKISQLKESYFKKGATEGEGIDQEKVLSEEIVTDERMKSYIDGLSKFKF